MKEDTSQTYKHLTISRDHTAASNIVRERLVALLVDDRSTATHLASRVKTTGVRPTRPTVLIPPTEPESLVGEAIYPSIVDVDHQHSMDEEAGQAVRGTSGHLNPEQVPSGRRITMRDLEARVKQLEEENNILRQGLPPDQDKAPVTSQPPVFQIVNYVDGTKTAFLGEPNWETSWDDTDQGLGLKGNQPVADLGAFFRHKKTMAFKVNRWFIMKTMPNIEQVREAVKAGLDLPDPIPSETQIEFVSSEMRGAFKAFIDIARDYFGVFPAFDSSKDPWSPYPFWFHCRGIGLVERLPDKDRRFMRLMTDWIEKEYGDEYSRAHMLFQRGLATKFTMSYLVGPGEVFTYRENGQIRAYRARSWPKDRSHDTGSPTHRRDVQDWEVVAWAYRYNGQFWQHIESLKLYFASAPEDNAEVAISSLRIVPLRFEPEELKLKLTRRGETFWKCRHQRFVSIRSQDTSDQLSRVSIQSVFCIQEKIRY